MSASTLMWVIGNKQTNVFSYILLNCDKMCERSTCITIQRKLCQHWEHFNDNKGYENVFNPISELKTALKELSESEVKSEKKKNVIALEQNIKKPKADKLQIYVNIRELKLDITSLTITAPSLHHHFLRLFVYLRFVAGLVLLSTNLG